jgi:hypothetical protein
MENSSYDINKAYDYMKQMIADLPAIVETNKEKVESFTLYPYPDPEPPLEGKVKEYAEKYKLVPKEIYSVIDKFDIAPSSLSEKDKELRKKYLKILIDVVQNETDTFKGHILTVGEHGPASNPFFLSNVDPAASLIVRIANLLLLEIDPVVCRQGQEPCPVCEKSLPCPSCPQCPTCKEPLPCPSCPQCPACKEPVPCPRCPDASSIACPVAPSPLPYIAVIVLLIISIIALFFMRR